MGYKEDQQFSFPNPSQLSKPDISDHAKKEEIQAELPQTLFRGDSVSRLSQI